MEDSVVKKKLMSLCCGNGWSYGIFWRFHQNNSMLLTFEDAYYEEQMGAVGENQLLQVHMLGEGIIGEVALTGKDQWIFSDAANRVWKSCNFDGSEDVLKDSALDCQYSCGIKTIAVISVEPWGVIQFGSTQKILERLEFFSQTKNLFRDMEKADVHISLCNAPSFFGDETNDMGEWVGSLISPGNYSGGNNTQLRALASPLVPEIQQERSQPMLEEPSHSKNQQQTTWSCEGSVVTSFQSPLPSQTTLLDADGAMFCSLDYLGEFVDMENFQLDSFGDVITGQDLTASIHEGEVITPENSTSGLAFLEKVKSADFVEDLSEFFSMDDLSQWFSPSPLRNTGGTAAMLSDSHSQPTGVNSVSNILFEGDVTMSTPIIHPADSMHSSITNTFNSSVRESSFHVNCPGSSTFDGMGINCAREKAGNFVNYKVMPIENVTQSAISSAESDCISELIVGSRAVPRKGLFAELGLDELLDGIANSNSVTSSFEDHPPTAKRRKVGGSLVNDCQVKLGGFPPAGGISSLYNLEKSAPLSQKEVLPRSQVGLWIDDSYSNNARTPVVVEPKRSAEPTKMSRRRARPGESTRPRPKDRQQIQDRIKELRGLIPNGHKSSIDSLLDRTIKYMLFLQSVTKYADKLTQADEPKLIQQENRVILKDGNADNSGRGATWAFEVGSQTTVCPIIVEDLSPPGQMLIEMLCEDRGLFLEIADIIKGIGLNILKGVMEMQETKIRARFTVEANRQVTRMDVFWSLVQLLHDGAPSGIDATNQPSNATERPFPPLKSYEQPLVPLPIS